jgi:hypothetical protein
MAKRKGQTFCWIYIDEHDRPWKCVNTLLFIELSHN